MLAAVPAGSASTRTSAGALQGKRSFAPQGKRSFLCSQITSMSKSCFHFGNTVSDHFPENPKHVGGRHPNTVRMCVSSLPMPTGTDGNSREADWRKMIRPGKRKCTLKRTPCHLTCPRAVPLLRPRCAPAFLSRPPPSLLPSSPSPSSLRVGSVCFFSSCCCWEGRGAQRHDCAVSVFASWRRHWHMGAGHGFSFRGVLLVVILWFLSWPPLLR